MQITLMRHGKPDLPVSPWIAAFEMRRWIEEYDRSTVLFTDIPAASGDAARSATIVAASTAPRALSSVAALGQYSSYTDEVFREAELPYASWRRPRLPPHVWAAFFRLLWIFGYARGADSMRVTKERAKSAAQLLGSMAEKGPVMLVGHGIMNRLIANELCAVGWVGRSGYKSKYWSTSTYSLPAESDQ